MTIKLTLLFLVVVLLASVNAQQKSTQVTFWLGDLPKQCKQQDSIKVFVGAAPVSTGPDKVTVVTNQIGLWMCVK